MGELDDALNAGADEPDREETQTLLDEKPPNIVIASEDLTQQVIYIRQDLFEKVRKVADAALVLCENYGEDGLEDVLDELHEDMDNAVLETGV